MFYDDFRALKQICENRLDESSSEVSPNLLLDISALSLRCASRWLAEKQSYIWARALEFWNQATAMSNAIQNFLSGCTTFSSDDRREFLQRAADDCYQTLFRIEDLLVDIAKHQTEENAKKGWVSFRFVIATAATPLRRTESTPDGLLSKTKSWMTLVYQAREVVWKALDLGEDDRNPMKFGCKKLSFTQHSSARMFLTHVIKALSQPRPGSWSDVRIPSFWFLFAWTRTDEQKLQLKKSRHEEAPQELVLSAPISSAFRNTSLQFHIPFWDSAFYRGIKYGVATCFGLVGFVAFRRTQPDLLPSAFQSTLTWFGTHLLEPARAMAEDLFFNRGLKASSRDAAKEANVSLHRMVDDFRRDRVFERVDVRPNSSPSEYVFEDISRAYETEMTRGFKSVMMGDLGRLALIQAQALKAETLNLGAEMDEMLAENHFNSQILATLPALGILSAVYRGVARLYRYLNDETNSRESARRGIRLALWDLEVLLIREDDGPTLFSFLTNGDRGSETEGNANLGQVIFIDDEDFLQHGTLVEESHGVDPGTQCRRQTAGQMICTVHHLINLLVKSKSVLFRRRDREWLNAMRDSNNLFPREGWTARARLYLVRTMVSELMALPYSSDFQVLINW